MEHQVETGQHPTVQPQTDLDAAVRDAAAQVPMQIPDDRSSWLHQAPNSALKAPPEGDARQGLTQEEIHDNQAETLAAVEREIESVGVDEANAWAAEAEVLSRQSQGCPVGVYAYDRQLRVSLP